MASAMPGGSPKPVEYVKQVGSKFHAKVPGLDQLIPLDHPAVNLHLSRDDTMFEPTDGSPMVGLHKARHGGGIPPALLKIIEEAERVLTQLQEALDYAASDTAMPSATDEEEPDAGMPGGSSMAA